MNKLDLRLKRLDWYIIKKFLGTFFFCFLVIVVVVIIIDISEKIDDFVDNEAPIRAIVFNYYLNFIPYIVNMFSPLFVFITVIFFTSKMANNSEIIAMLSCGESFGRLMYPYMLSAAVIAFMSLMLGLYVIPPANKVRLQFQQEYIKHHPTYITDRNIHYQLSPGNYVYLESFSAWNSSAYRMTLETMEDNKIKSKLTADRAAWDTTFNGWRLSNCFLREYDMYGNQSLKTFDTVDTVISLTIEDFLRREDIVETLNAPRLNELIATQRVRGDKMVDYTLIEKHKRLSMPFSAFILTIMGVSLSSKKRRGGLGLNIGIGLALSFSYILFMRFSEMFVHTGVMSPMVALWMPNILYIFIALAVYRMAPK